MRERIFQIARAVGGQSNRQADFCVEEQTIAINYDNKHSNELGVALGAQLLSTASDLPKHILSVSLLIVSAHTQRRSAPEISIRQR